ncbi:hypothetical protein CBS101457_006646 [Exobasidium rhododendri]|nr:hypothetical protein CBS101457_006646 [Exobasidium rhododendri]
MLPLMTTSSTKKTSSTAKSTQVTDEAVAKAKELAKPSSYLPVTNATDETTTSAVSSTNVTVDSIGTATSHVPGTMAVTPLSSCFPTLQFSMPEDVPTSFDDWWCNPEDEYGFLGISYNISACPSVVQLTKDFQQAKSTFNARYIQIYGVCDDVAYYDNVVEAAWNVGVGVQALLLLGSDGSSKDEQRKSSLLQTMNANPKARFITRAVQMASNPLLDGPVNMTALSSQFENVQQNLTSLQIPVTVSTSVHELKTKMVNASQEVIDAGDFVDLRIAPQFATNTSTSVQAWNKTMNDMDLIVDITNSSKKIIWSEDGGHTRKCDWKPHSLFSKSNATNKKAYYDFLDSKCTDLKKYPQGGIGWFAHLYNDKQKPGYGIYNLNGTLRFDFQPQIVC